MAESSCNRLASNGMDQEIEAQAKEFLAFLEQCSQHTRASATADITLCLAQLRIFLERIQPIIESAATDASIDTATSGVVRVEGVILDASTLYHTLEPLLSRLCGNPVALANEAIADLIAKSVLKYSKLTADLWNDGWSTHGRGRQASEMETFKARLQLKWRVARMRDMFQIPRRWCPSELKRNDFGKEHAVGYVDRNVETRGRSKDQSKGVFEDLFQVTEQEIRQQRLEETIGNLSKTLRDFEDIVLSLSEPLMETDLLSMVQWNRQLSGLYAPLVSKPTTTALTERIIDVAYTIKTRLIHVNGTSSLSPPVLLDNAFVEQVMLLSGNYGPTLQSLRGHRALLRLSNVSSIARQRHVVQLVDSVIVASVQHPEFSLSREDILAGHLSSPSSLFSIMSSNRHLAESQELVQPVLEDLARVAGEISDWRFVRICILLTEWVLSRRQHYRHHQEDMDVDHTNFVGSDLRAAPDTDTSTAIFFSIMVSSACSLLENHPTKSSTSNLSNKDHTQSGEMSQWMSAQKSYIFCSAGPHQLPVRRSLVFLIGMAIAQRNNFLVQKIRNHFEALEKPQQYQGLSDVANPLTLFIAGLVLAFGPESSLETAVHETLGKMLREIQKTE
ncbi:hypothetical protein BGZ54_005999 [Gamsiella multidivaricata]|nr:hypothetical protein BGZ54_005999 [Gamsiella multidivaricata]